MGEEARKLARSRFRNYQRKGELVEHSLQYLEELKDFLDNYNCKNPFLMPYVDKLRDSLHIYIDRVNKLGSETQSSYVRNGVNMEDNTLLVEFKKGRIIENLVRDIPEKMDSDPEAENSEYDAYLSSLKNEDKIGHFAMNRGIQNLNGFMLHEFYDGVEGEQNRDLHLVDQITEILKNRLHSMDQEHIELIKEKSAEFDNKRSTYDEISKFFEHLMEIDKKYRKDENYDFGSMGAEMWWQIDSVKEETVSGFKEAIEKHNFDYLCQVRWAIKDFVNLHHNEECPELDGFKDEDIASESISDELFSRLEKITIGAPIMKKEYKDEITSLKKHFSGMNERYDGLIEMMEELNEVDKWVVGDDLLENLKLNYKKHKAYFVNSIKDYLEISCNDIFSVVSSSSALKNEYFEDSAVSGLLDIVGLDKLLEQDSELLIKNNFEIMQDYYNTLKDLFELFPELDEKIALTYHTIRESFLIDEEGSENQDVKEDVKNKMVSLFKKITEELKPLSELEKTLEMTDELREYQEEAKKDIKRFGFESLKRKTGVSNEKELFDFVYNAVIQGGASLDIGVFNEALSYFSQIDDDENKKRVTTLKKAETFTKIYNSLDEYQKESPDLAMMAYLIGKDISCNEKKLKYIAEVIVHNPNIDEIDLCLFGDELDLESALKKKKKQVFPAFKKVHKKKVLGKGLGALIPPSVKELSTKLYLKTQMLFYMEDYWENTWSKVDSEVKKGREDKDYLENNFDFYKKALEIEVKRRKCISEIKKESADLMNRLSKRRTHIRFDADVFARENANIMVSLKLYNQINKNEDNIAGLLALLSKSKFRNDNHLLTLKERVGLIKDQAQVELVNVMKPSEEFKKLYRHIEEEMVERQNKIEQRKKVLDSMKNIAGAE